MEIYSVTYDELGKEWKEIVGKRKLLSAVVADQGACDAKTVLMDFGTRFEVGVGECLVPYECLYRGRSLAKASRIWLAWITS
jgi:hypothetical protein